MAVFRSTMKLDVNPYLSITRSNIIATNSLALANRRAEELWLEAENKSRILNGRHWQLDPIKVLSEKK